ncbi:unnamed protein product [Protopolystoma xenopodis]|uniref:Uncharacterized protein n=1 Tax=Protopolystoma xenopodis TaxID=117903 RepID=A0A3S5CMG9_9PLAT|nr:unnamed protein product [Protopolystoma xenopodis]
MAPLTYDTNYDAGETIGNVPGQRSNAENHEYYARGYGTRYVPQGISDAPTELRKQGRTHLDGISIYSQNSVLSFPPMSYKSVSLQADLVKRNNLHNRYQMLFAWLLNYILSLFLLLRSSICCC